ncbi:MAG: hypothetical protein AAGI70_05510 [Pseudomonadota bacterium]
MVERQSALAGAALPMKFGPDLTISERRVGAIWQVTAWPESLAAAGAAAADAAGVGSAPGPGKAVEGDGASLLRTGPLRWLIVSEAEISPPPPGAWGTLLDLSHARTVLRLEGPAVPDLMARQMPLDLRPKAFPEGSVATSGIHHVAVTVLAREGGLELFCFRSFGRAMLDHLAESAAQFAV